MGDIVRRGVGIKKLDRPHASTARHGSLGEVGDTRSALVDTESGDGQRAVGDFGEMCEQLIDRCHTVADIRKRCAVAFVEHHWVVRMSDRRIDWVAAQQALRDPTIGQQQ
jgi:hypothetical protein